MPRVRGKRYPYTAAGKKAAAKAAKKPANPRAKAAASRKAAAAKKPAATAKPRTNPNPRGRRGAAKTGSVNTATNRNFDAAPGATNQNPRARAISLKKDVTGGVKTKAGTYKTYKKNSAAAKSFRSAFSAAKKQGYKTFTWNGKKYNTKTK